MVSPNPKRNVCSIHSPGANSISSRADSSVLGKKFSLLSDSKVNSWTSLVWMILNFIINVYSADAKGI